MEPEASARDQLVSLLRREGYAPETVLTPQGALERLEKESFPLMLCACEGGGLGGLALLRKVKKIRPQMAVVIMGPASDRAAALAAIKEGAEDYLHKPCQTEELVLALQKTEERERQKKEIIERVYRFENIIAKSPKMLEIFETIKKISEYKTTVLLTGESGTGKEVIARAIHYNSSRAEQPFVTVNCGAIPENLLESELFGHVKGAFTGAHRNKPGLFEEADGGTLFLDEIGELPLLLQVKLLRALQEEEIRRVGDTAAIKVNVRIIAATIKDLAKEVESGNFREDLFYRLNVLNIAIPPLRSRREDIPLLAEYFIQKYNKKLGVKLAGIEPEALNLLIDCDWPGNVRELENAMERAMVMTHGEHITSANLPAHLRGKGAKSGFRLAEDEYSIKKMTRLLEEELILKALAKTRGNRTQAAKILEISHRALLYKIKEFALEEKIDALES